MKLVTLPEEEKNVIQIEILKDGQAFQGIIFPLKILEGIVKDFQNRGICYGELISGMRLSVGIQMSDVSHIVQRLYMQDDALFAEIRIIETEKGLILLQVLDHVSFNICGSGVVDKNNVILNFDFITIHASQKP